MGLLQEIYKISEGEKAKRQADMDEERRIREAEEAVENTEAVIDEAAYNKLHDELEKEIAYNNANPRTDFARDVYENYGITSPATFAMETRLRELEGERSRYLQQAASAQIASELAEKINLISDEVFEDDTAQATMLTPATMSTPATMLTTQPAADSSNLITIAIIGIVSFFLFFK